VRLLCRTLSVLFPSPLFSLPCQHFLILLLSQHLLVASTFGIIMNDQKLGQPPPSIPYCTRPRSRGLAPQQRLHLLSHPPIWTTIYTRSYSLPPHFSPLFIASSHHRSPTYRRRALPWRTMSFSNNSNMVTHRRRFIFNKPNQRSPLLQSLPAPVRFNSSIPTWTLAQQSWYPDVGNICSPTL